MKFTNSSIINLLAFLATSASVSGQLRHSEPLPRTSQSQPPSSTSESAARFRRNLLLADGEPCNSKLQCEPGNDGEQHCNGIDPVTGFGSCDKRPQGNLFSYCHHDNESDCTGSRICEIAGVDGDKPKCKKGPGGCCGRDFVCGSHKCDTTQDTSGCRLAGSIGLCEETTSSTDAPSEETNDCNCDTPSSIPTECEVELLAEMMDLAIAENHKLAAQWLRLAFHDAGTFNDETQEGGANGCLMNDPRMREEDENNFLDIPINTLEVIKDEWEANHDTCIAISAADMIQFAGHFAAIRQTGTPGMTSTKTLELMSFEWGRNDEPGCDPSWTENLPGFQRLVDDTDNIPVRCLHAGKQIKDKMMVRNGFSAKESAALIGAHTIGLTRNSFGRMAGPWVVNGADDATLDGPVFDNAFHDFLANEVSASTPLEFSEDLTPFTQQFNDWFRDGPNDLNHLDTDIALAFPTQDSDVHPDFHAFTVEFANDNEDFLLEFFAALSKMSKLGVNETTLGTPTDCLSECTSTAELEVGEAIQLTEELNIATEEGEVELARVLDSPSVREQREFDTTELMFDQIKDPVEAEEELLIEIGRLSN